MSDKRLKPCPFCGGEAVIHKSKFGYGVMCKNTKFCCDLTAAHATEEEAIQMWNIRKPMERIVERLEGQHKAFICKNTEPCDYPERIGCCYDKAINEAIEIVKGGGVDEVDCRVTKEEAIELLKAYVGNEYYTEKWQETCRMAIDALNGQAEPVVHGEWIPHDRMTRSPLVKNYACSNCGVDGHRTNYCPNCGAKMKGGGQNE